MHKIKGNKWNRRICKWIASLLTVTLLVNQSSFVVLAEEIKDEVCQCDIRCGTDSVNEDCPVCAQDYGRCEGAEYMTDTDMGEETENSGEGEGINTDTETAPDTATDEGIEGFDSGESDTDTEAEGVSDMEENNEGNTLPQDNETKNENGENAVSPASVEDTFDDSIFRYSIMNEDKNGLQVEVIGYAGAEPGFGQGLALDIPPTVINGTNIYTVVRIGDKAFQFNSYLKSITIPDSVTSIGEYAFADINGSLESIIIPNTVTSIGKGAFSNCRFVKSITMPEKITSIEDSTFLGCGCLESIIIPDSVTNIGGWAFAYCQSLESISIPEKITSIEEKTFLGCESLKSRC